MPHRLVPSPETLARDLNGEILILDLRTSQYFGLTGTGARIWQLLEAGRQPDTLASVLAEEFTGDAGRIDEEVTGFIAELVDRGLLVADPT